MDFKKQLKQLGDRVAKPKDENLTEEISKNAIANPYTQCFGYEVFNSLGGVPEFLADIGNKDKKSANAIIRYRNPAILLERNYQSANFAP